MNDFRMLALHDSCLMDAYVKTNIDSLNQTTSCEVYRRVEHIECLRGGKRLKLGILYRFQVGFGLRCSVSNAEEEGDQDQESSVTDPGLRLLASFQLDYLSKRVISEKTLRAYAKKFVLSDASFLWKDWLGGTLIRLPLTGDLRREITNAAGISTINQTL